MTIAIVSTTLSIDGDSSGGPTRLEKTDPFSPVFTKSGSIVSIKAGTKVFYNGSTYNFSVATNVTLPTLVAGTDYRIVAKTDSTLQAITYTDTVPTGGLVIGGFHYLPGGYPTGFNAGGSWTATILEWSFWDLNFRPKCDPRGMTRIGAAGFWIDIYFATDSYPLDGVSKNNEKIICGNNPPVKSADYGGNGTTKLTTFNWWDANELVRQWWKRLPSYEEMCLAGFGTNESDGRGLHPVKTGLNAYNAGASSDPNFTSKWGLIQVTGVMWMWTKDLSDWQGTNTTNSWGWEAYDVTGGRGKAILQNDADLTALLYGASSVYQGTTSPTGATGVAGSRAVETIEKLWDTSDNIAVRGVSDHFVKF